MKKLLLPISFLAVTCTSVAQTYFEEDFEAGLGQFTSLDNDGDGNEWNTADVTDNINSTGESAVSNSWANNPLTPDNLLTSSLIDLSSATGAVFINWNAGNTETTNNWWEEYYDVIVTASNATADILAATPVFGEVLPNGGEMLSKGIDISSFTGQSVYVTFRHHNCTDNNFLILDDIKVKTVAPIDAELTSLALTPIIVAGNVDIEGTITNVGADPITSIDIDWNDGTGSNSETFAVSINAGETYDFTHGTPLAATAGSTYNVDVTVTVTGDADVSNNSLTSTSSAASASGTRLPLAEVFTSSTCPPCYALNVTSGYDGSGLDNGLASLNANDDETAEIATIKWQVNWPGNGDHAYNSEVGARVGYYNIGAAPSQVMDGNEVAITPASLATSTANESYLDIDASFSQVGNDVSVSVTVSPYVSISNARVMIALLEKEYDGTNNSSFSNGETKFHNVFRKLLPAQGTTTNLVDGTDFVVTENYTTTVNTGLPSQGSFDFHAGTEMEVVVFVEDPATNTIYNAAIAKNLTASIDEDNLSFGIVQFPNPTTGMSNIVLDLKESANVNIEVVNVLGSVVFQNGADVNAGSSAFSVDLSDQASGVYFANINVNGQTKTIKINVAK